jgi:hypothetical protein
MALEQALRTRLAGLLAAEDQSVPGPRLAADARRLWERVGRFLGMNLAGEQMDRDALELACYALQLPLRQNRGQKLVRGSLRERCEQAAELMVSLFGREAEENLLDRTARVLQEIPQKSPMIDEARLLADAVNLDDFGLIGLFNQAMLLALGGEAVDAIAAASEKRELYGYWEARLKDGFHYEAIRDIARRRLADSRKVSHLLQHELGEDRSK